MGGRRMMMKSRNDEVYDGRKIWVCVMCDGVKVCGVKVWKAWGDFWIWMRLVLPVIF